MRLVEAFDRALDIANSSQGQNNEKHIFKTATNLYRININKKENPHLNLWDVGFAVWYEGRWIDRRTDAQFNEQDPKAVFSTVLNEMRKFIERRQNIHVLRFAGADDKLTALYTRMARQMTPPRGYVISSGSFYPNGGKSFVIHIDQIDPESLAPFLRTIA